MTNPKYRVAVTAAILLAVAAALAYYYYTHDPATGAAPRCLFRLVTGAECPGCGSQRAFHALLHGRIADAWAFNPFIFFAVPAALFFIIAEAGREAWPRFHAGVVRPVVIIAVLVAVLAWWIVRNIV